MMPAADAAAGAGLLVNAGLFSSTVRLEVLATGAASSDDLRLLALDRFMNIPTDLTFWRWHTPSPDGNGLPVCNGRRAAKGNGYPSSILDSDPPLEDHGRKLRILVLSVSVGAGHVRAAEAIELALGRIVPEAHVQNVDVLQLSTAPFRRCYGQMYLDLIDVAPQVLGYFYGLMDQPRPAAATRWDRLRILLEKMSMRPFLHLLDSEPWDLVINTHFLSAEIIAHLRQQKRFLGPQVMVTTDFETHRLWAVQGCDHFFTATEEAALYLKCFGVPPQDVTTTGIPIHPSFSKAKDRAGCLLRHGLAGDRPILLQLSGGNGVGPIEELYRAVLDIERPLELIVVTGRNAAARAHLEGMAAPPRHRVHILGYTREMDEWMLAADLVITKPGGLTTAEALARGTPIVIANPVPGQEERNSDYLLENGAGIKVNHVPTLAHKVSAVLNDAGRRARLKENARRLGRPRAAIEIGERALALLGRVGPRATARV